MTERGTDMIHFSCDVCGMTATMVVTPATELAWLDHMDTHSAKKAYRAWTWSVLALELEQDPVLVDLERISSR